MAKEDIRRYSAEQLSEMNRRGEFVPTPDDAPGFDGDDEFWAMMERGVKDGFVQLSVNPDTVDYFRKSGPDYLERMAKILDDEARKAS